VASSCSSSKSVIYHFDRDKLSCNMAFFFLTPHWQKYCGPQDGHFIFSLFLSSILIDLDQISSPRPLPLTILTTCLCNLPQLCPAQRPLRMDAAVSSKMLVSTYVSPQCDKPVNQSVNTSVKTSNIYTFFHVHAFRGSCICHKCHVQHYTTSFDEIWHWIVWANLIATYIMYLTWSWNWP
jgi:hypothetical protein